MTDPFGLDAVDKRLAEIRERADKLEKAYRRGFVIALCLISLGAAVLIGYHSKAPEVVTAEVEPAPGGLLWRASRLELGQGHCRQDLRGGDCFECIYRDTAGNRIGGYAC